MTLNISIISPAGIHQSADFRLSKLVPDSGGNWIIEADNSAKILSLHYQDWSGLLTYCGIGMWNWKRTDEYVSEWIAEAGNSNATVDDILAIVQKSGTEWLKEINRSAGKIQPHSFTLAAFQQGLPTYGIVSNNQTLTAEIRPLSAELQSESRTTSDIHIFVTGIRSAVPKLAKIRLKKMVRVGTDPRVLRHELAKISRAASESATARNGISPSCLVFSHDQNGAGNGEIHGAAAGSVMPRSIHGGMDILGQLRHLNPSMNFVQAAFSTSKSNEVVIGEQINCKLSITRGSLDPGAPCISEIEQLGSINEFQLEIRSVGVHRSTVGQIRKPLAALPHAFFWPYQGDILDLGTFGGPFSNAFDVNGKDQVVGAAHVDQSARHAFVWHRDSGLVDLGTLGGRDSVACGINEAGWIVGNSFVDEGNPTQDGERAFLWTKDSGMKNLGVKFDGWSRAQAINDDGIVLGWRLRGGIVCGYIWSHEFGAVDIVGVGGRAFYPSAINNAGVVVGEGDDAKGKRCAFSWSRDGGLQRLDIAEEFHPADIDDEGNIIGNFHSKPWIRPLFYTSRGEALALPFADDHHTSVFAMNSVGVIVGAAHKDNWKHTHPLVWSLGARSALTK